MSPEIAQLLDVIRSVAIGLIAASLLGIVILAAFLFPTVVESFRARTRRDVETTIVMPLIERDLAKIAAHGEAGENLLRELRDAHHANASKLDSIFDRVKSRS